MNAFFSTIQKWISNSRLGVKILLPSLLAFVLVIILFLIYSVSIFNAENQAREIENKARTEQIISTELQKLNDFSLGLAIQAAENPEIQEAFANQNRERLQALTLDSFNALEEKFGIRQYQYHLPPAQSFLRLHSLGNFGDDLSSFRATVVQVNQTQEGISGIEVGRGGVGLRGVQPVFYNGKHIGSVEFGLNIDSNFVIDLKEKYGNEWRIMLNRESLELATLEDISLLTEGPTPDLLVLGTTIQGNYQELDVYPKILAGESLTSQILNENGQILLVASIPIKDHDNKIIGLVESIVDNTSIIQTETNRFLLIC